MNHWTNGWFFLSGYLSRLFILSVFRSPPDSQPFWSIKQFSCLAAKRYKSFTLLCIMSCIMHWLAVIKTFILLSSYSGWDPSSGVLFNFGCFSRRFCRAQVLHFTFFSLLPHLPFCLCSASTPAFSSHLATFFPSASISTQHLLLSNILAQSYSQT